MILMMVQDRRRMQFGSSAWVRNEADCRSGIVACAPNCTSVARNGVRAASTVSVNGGCYRAHFELLRELWMAAAAQFQER